MQSKQGFWTSLYQNLASMKLTVVIFLTLAACSLVGTLLPQGASQAQLQREFGPGLASWINAFGLSDLYHTNWFRLLLLLLCVNLIVCTLRRLPKTIRLLRHREDHIKPEKLLKFTYNAQLTVPLPVAEVQPRLEKIIAQNFAPAQQLPGSGPYSGIAEKGRWGRLVVYGVHLSVLIILLGALVGSLFGFKGFMNITQGDTANQVWLSRENKALSLPFQVRCNLFKVSYYKNGAPKEYLSNLTILDKGKPVLKKSIRVNHPLTYKGITFYQASYGATLKQAKVEFTDTTSGKNYELNLPFRKSEPLPGTQDKVQIVEYRQNLANFGPALAIALLQQNKDPVGSWILADKPEFHGNRVQNFRVKVLDTQQIYYTGLQVKKDQGVWFVWLGFIALILGIGITFCSSHRKVWVWADSAKPHKTRIILGGRASKNQFAFEKEFNDLAEQIRQDLKPQQGV